MHSRKRPFPLVAVLSLLSLPALLAATNGVAPQPSSAPPARTTVEKGASVAFSLPTEGPLPKTYLVTLAIVDPKDTKWVVSTFVAGRPFTVTEENQGKFTATWNGLDENFMPVPPGEYSVKGIYMPAVKWDIDDDWHAVVPKYAGTIAAWTSRITDPHPREPFGGDPVNSPMKDVAVGPNGVAVFYYQYLENGRNCPMVDLNKAVGPEQFLRAFRSGGAGGGPCVATDGESAWAFSTDGGPKYVYRTDEKSFGSSPSANRRNSYLPEGWVTAMAAWRNTESNRSFVYIAQRGKILSQDVKKGNRVRARYTEDDEAFVNLVTVHDGDNGHQLASVPIEKPRGLVVQGGLLYALHAQDTGYAVSSVPLNDGLPEGDWQQVFKVPSLISPSDLEVDRHGRFYLSDSKANKVYQLDAKANLLRTFGRLPVQKAGSYDPETLISPERLATWTDDKGGDRLIIVEMGGPNRASEWNADTGSLVRDFPTYQTRANDGYGLDPDHPDHLYIPGHQDWLVRFKGDFAKGTWAVDAVWPNVGNDPKLPKLVKPVLFRVNGTLYLAGGRSCNVYRLTDNACLLSAGIIVNGKNAALWHDANGNGKVDDDEMVPTPLPGQVITYHGQNWLSDLSYLAIAQNGRDVWRLVPAEFDSQGNPVYKEWRKLLTDPIFMARAAGKADAVHGGNELAESYNSDWAQADGSDREGFYVQARGGRNFTANYGAQHKISYYAPDQEGRFNLQWRVGRTALGNVAGRGEIYGAMRLRRPINGILSVIDQSRCGILLYDKEGLYIDTLFPDIKRVPHETSGIYQMPGEFFAGSLFPNQDNGKIYICVGKYTPLLFETEGWSLKENPVRPLASLPKTVTIASSQIASPPELALSLRGGPGKAKLARFAPALGGASLDGSLAGWESCSPIRFESDRDQSVEVRCLYDREHLYLRWHVRKGFVFEAKPLPALPRIFTHDLLADTVDFYFQGDPEAKPGARDGRPGDIRFIFGLFKNRDTIEPVGIGLYPEWKGPGPANPQTYRTPVATATFAHVGAIEGARYGSALDKDGKGFVLAVELPRTAIPSLEKPFGNELKTMVNFSANLGGHNKFWWANSDGSANAETYDEPSEAKFYPGSWAPVSFLDILGGVAVRNWLICGPFGGEEAKAFSWNPKEDQKPAVRKFYDTTVYPPDDGNVDLSAVYTGAMVRGHWADPKQVKWKPAAIADLDTRVILGSGAQLWFGATWIHAPEATELDFEFQGHNQTTLRWTLNGTKIDPGPYKPRVPLYASGCTAAKTLTLQQGWNQILFRGYCEGYAPFRVGLVLKGPQEKLWPLKFSAAPPKETNP